MLVCLQLLRLLLTGGIQSGCWVAVLLYCLLVLLQVLVVVLKVQPPGTSGLPADLCCSSSSVTNFDRNHK
jgi:hypothetical protein